jgi:hypothetical protein
MMRRPAAALLLPLALLVTLVATTAHGHPPHRETAWLSPWESPDPPEVGAAAVVAPGVGGARTNPPIPWAPLLILAALLVPVARSRRTVAGLLIALLAIFAFEAGLHSVHHLGDEAEEARCIVAAGTPNLIGAVGEPVTFGSIEEPGEVALRLEPNTLPQRVLHPYQGRAPPFLG